MDPFPELRLGRTGGVIWPSYVHQGLSRPVPVCLRQPASADWTGDCRQEGAYCYLPASNHTNLTWFAPFDLAKPRQAIKSSQGRAKKEAEQVEDIAVVDQLKNYRSHSNGSAVPPELLRGLLSEVSTPTEARSNARLLGNRLSSVCLEDGETVLVAHATGPAGETLAVSVLTVAKSLHNLQWDASCNDSGSSPIHQIAFSHPQQGSAHSINSLPLLAIRSHYWLRIFKVECKEKVSNRARAASQDLSEDDIEPETEREWQLVQVGSMRAHSRTVHYAWNPILTSELAFLCEDGNVGVVDAFTGVPGAENDLRSTLIRQDHGGSETSVLTCEWADHPRLLYCLQGHRVMRLDLRASLRQPLATAFHSTLLGEFLVAISSPVPGSSLVALATQKSILLLDATRPQQALLKWDHGLANYVPQRLSLHLQRLSSNLNEGSAGRDADLFATEDAQRFAEAPERRAGLNGRDSSSGRQPNLVGCILAIGPATGQVVAYRFASSSGTTCLVPHPPGHRSMNTIKVEDSSFGSIAVLMPQTAGSNQSPEQAFSWTPRLAATLHSLDIPQRLALPLKQRRASEDQRSLPLAVRKLDEESRKTLGEAPDIQGAAAVPVSGLGSGDSLLLRLDALGDLYLDTCSLFSPSLVPASAAAKCSLHRVTLHLPAEADKAGSEAAEEAGTEEEDFQIASTHQQDTPTQLLELLAFAIDRWRSSIKGDADAEALNTLGYIARAKALRNRALSRLRTKQALSRESSLSLAESNTLDRILDSMKVPMTVSDLHRELQLWQPAAEGEPDSHPGDGTGTCPRALLRDGRVPDVDPPGLPSGSIMKLSMSQSALHDAARHLTKLLSARGDMLRLKLAAIESAVGIYEGRVRISPPVCYHGPSPLIGSYAREAPPSGRNTFPAMHAAAASGAGTIVQCTRSLGGHVHACPVKTGSSSRGSAVRPGILLDPELTIKSAAVSELAKPLLESLEAAWPEQEAVGMATQMPLAPSQPYQSQTPAQDAEVARGDATPSLGMPSSQPPTGRPKKKKRRVMQEGFS